MKCDLCDNEATVHEVSVQGGRQVDRHFCERCAASRGLAVRPPTTMQQIVIQAVMTPGAAAAPEGATTGAPAGACDSCGQTFSQFRQSGLMGCPRCYAAFEGQLGPLLSRAHEGGTHHVGKSPRSAAGGKTPPATTSDPASAQSAAPGTRARAAALRKQLSEAVAAEQYERAAALRDELRALEQPSVAQPAKPPPAPGPARARRARPAQGQGGAEPEGT